MCMLLLKILTLWYGAWNRSENTDGMLSYVITGPTHQSPLPLNQSNFRNINSNMSSQTTHKKKAPQPNSKLMLSGVSRHRPLQWQKFITAKQARQRREQFDFDFKPQQHTILSDSVVTELLSVGRRHRNEREREKKRKAEKSAKQQLSHRMY